MIRSGGQRGVVRHRAGRLGLGWLGLSRLGHGSSGLRPRRRRALLLGAAVLAMAAPLVAGAPMLAIRHERLHPDRLAHWITPVVYELDPEALNPTGPAGDQPPTRLRIPSLGVETPLETLTLAGSGELNSPEKYGEAGWYADGTLPGEVGPAVIAGHVDSRTGPAVFYRLHQLKAGARVEVERGGEWVEFVVMATEHYAKASFPSERVYGPTPGPELRLITCGGSFDAARHSYRDNVVVYAVAA